MLTGCWGLQILLVVRFQSTRWEVVGAPREMEASRTWLRGLVGSPLGEIRVRIVGMKAPPRPSPRPVWTCWGHRLWDHAILFLLPLLVCHQGTDHGGPGSDLNHRQHPHPAQRLPPQEGSEAVTERKPAPERDLKSRLQLDLVESTLSELSPEEGLPETLRE